MKKNIYNFFQNFFSIFKLRVTRLYTDKRTLFENILSLKNVLNKSNLSVFEVEFFEHLLQNFKNSQSEKFQDLFVDYIMKKKSGFFIEFGCCDGLYLSNTFFLEKFRGWNGILIEPSKIYHSDLKKNRDNCKIDFRCVHSISNDYINFFENKFQYNKKNTSNENYQVLTVSLNDIFIENKLISVDFLSIDTDGSEYEILSNFNFNKFKVNIFIVEHNYSSSRSKILNLMKKNNYVNIFNDISAHDDWFVRNEFLPLK